MEARTLFPRKECTLSCSIDEDDRLVMSIGGGNYGFFASFRPASAAATGLQ